MKDLETKESKIKKYLHFTKQIQNQEYVLMGISMRPKIGVISGLKFLHKQDLLKEIVGLFNLRIPEQLINKAKPNNKLLIEWSVAEKQREDGLLHVHSIVGIHKSRYKQFIELLQEKKNPDGTSRLFIKENLMKKKFPLLHEVEIEILHDPEGWINYMFKNYVPNVDLDGQEPDHSYCLEIKGLKPSIISRDALDKISFPEDIIDRNYNRFIGNFRKLVKSRIHNSPSTRFNHS